MKAPKRAGTNRGGRPAECSPEYFKSLVDNTLDIITVLSSTGIILYESPSVQGVLGYKPEELTGRSVFDFLHPNDAPGIANALGSRIKTPEGTELREFRFKHRNGTWRTFEGRGKNLLDDPVIAGVIVSSRDITERKQVEQALRQSEELFSRAFRASPIAISMSNLREDGSYRYFDVNDRFLTLTGYHWEEVIGRTSTELRLWVSPRDRIKIREMLSKTGAARDVEVDWRTKSGEIRNIISTTEAFELKGQQCIITFALNITERKQDLEELRRARGQFETILQAITDAVSAQDSGGRLVFANEAMAQLIGYPSAQAMLQEPPKDFFKQHELTDESGRPFPMDQLPVFQALRGVPNPTATVCWRNVRTGAERWSVARAVQILDVQGRIQLVINIIHDITDLKRAEQGLRELAERRRAIALQILDAQERERERLARDLHDELGQILTAVGMDSDWIARHSETTDHLREVASQLRTKVEQAVELVRILSHRLRPSVLDDLGIGPALESLGSEVCKRSKLQCEVSIGAKMEEMTQGVTTAIYRIAQEALTNVMRHSGAQKVWVTLRTTDGSVILQVKDDGKGIPEAQWNNPKSLGLAGMRERATLLNGELTITPRRGGGTLVTARIPLRNE